MDKEAREDCSEQCVIHLHKFLSLCARVHATDTKASSKRSALDSIVHTRRLLKVHMDTLFTQALNVVKQGEGVSCTGSAVTSLVASSVAVPNDAVSAPDSVPQSQSPASLYDSPIDSLPTSIQMQGPMAANHPQNLATSKGQQSLPRSTVQHLPLATSKGQQSLPRSTVQPLPLATSKGQQSLPRSTVQPLPLATSKGQQSLPRSTVQLPSIPISQYVFTHPPPRLPAPNHSWTNHQKTPFVADVSFPVTQVPDDIEEGDIQSVLNEQYEKEMHEAKKRSLNNVTDWLEHLNVDNEQENVPTDTNHVSSTQFAAAIAVHTPLLSNTSDMVLCRITSAVSPLDFYVQAVTAAKELTELHVQMQHYYDQHTTVAFSKLMVGVACCVCERIGQGRVQLHRASIQSVGSHDCHVLCVDTGALMYVPHALLWPLPLQFAVLPPMAYRCALHKCDARDLSTELSEHFVNLYVKTGKKVNVALPAKAHRTHHKQKGLYVQLYDPHQAHQLICTQFMKKPSVKQPLTEEEIVDAPRIRAPIGRPQTHDVAVEAASRLIDAPEFFEILQPPIPSTDFDSSTKLVEIGSGNCSERDLYVSQSAVSQSAVSQSAVSRSQWDRAIPTDTLSAGSDTFQSTTSCDVWPMTNHNQVEQAAIPSYDFGRGFFSPPTNIGNKKEEPVLNGIDTQTDKPDTNIEIQTNSVNEESSDNQSIKSNVSSESVRVLTDEEANCSDRSVRLNENGLVEELEGDWPGDSQNVTNFESVIVGEDKGMNVNSDSEWVLPVDREHIITANTS